MAGKKTGLFISNDRLSEYVYKTFFKKSDVFPFGFEETPFADSHTFKFGDITGILSALKKEKVDNLLMVGKIPPKALFEKTIHESGKLFLAGQTQWKGENLMSLAASLFEREGMHVLTLTSVLGKIIAENRVYTDRHPDAQVLPDIETGVSLINSLIGYRIGQAVALKKGMIIAIEGIEGTDAMIQRAGRYCEDFVVVKMAGKNKDERFDLPVIGPDTIKAMAKSGGSILAVEAGKTVLFEREKTLSLCKKNNIVLMGITPARPLKT